jgi:hypothetical protein
MDDHDDQFEVNNRHPWLPYLAMDGASMATDSACAEVVVPAMEMSVSRMVAELGHATNGEMEVEQGGARVGIARVLTKICCLVHHSALVPALLKTRCMHDM